MCATWEWFTFNLIKGEGEDGTNELEGGIVDCLVADFDVVDGLVGCLVANVCCLVCFVAMGDWLVAAGLLLVS